MKKITCEILVDEDKLKQYYMRLLDIESEDEYSFCDAFNSEIGWLNESGIYLLDWKTDNFWFFKNFIL